MQGTILCCFIRSYSTPNRISMPGQKWVHTRSHTSQFFLFSLLFTDNYFPNRLAGRAWRDVSSPSGCMLFMRWADASIVPTHMHYLAHRPNDIEQYVCGSDAADLEQARAFVVCVCVLARGWLRAMMSIHCDVHMRSRCYRSKSTNCASENRITKKQPAIETRTG